MRSQYVVGVTIAAALTAACSSSAGPSDLSDAYCADLRAGASVASLAGSAAQVINDMTPQRYAAQALVWVRASCPEQLRTNGSLRGFLDANGIDPDG